MVLLRAALPRAHGAQGAGGGDPLSRSPEALREAVGGEIDELRVVVPMVRRIRDCNGSRTPTIRPENKLKEPPRSSVADSRRRKPSRPPAIPIPWSRCRTHSPGRRRRSGGGHSPRRGGQLVGGGQRPGNREGASRRTGHKTRAQRLRAGGAPIRPCRKWLERRYAAAVSNRAALAPTPKNMVWVAGGEFLMGSDEFYPEERPATSRGRRLLDGRAPGHRRRVPALREGDRARHRRRARARSGATTPTPIRSCWCRARSSSQGRAARSTSTTTELVAWVPGAQWRHPEGPGSTLHGRERHPVAHVA